MSAVKQHFHDEIVSRLSGEDDQEPDLLEMLAMDAERAVARYQDEIAKRAAHRGEQK